LRKASMKQKKLLTTTNNLEEDKDMTNNNIKEMKYNPVLVGVLIGAFMLGYAFGPIDFIPDFLVGYGQIDDGLVLTIGSILEIINLIYGLNYSKGCQGNTTSYEEAEDDYGNYREL